MPPISVGVLTSRMFWFNSVVKSFESPKALYKSAIIISYGSGMRDSNSNTYFPRFSEKTNPHLKHAHWRKQKAAKWPLNPTQPSSFSSLNLNISVKFLQSMRDNNRNTHICVFFTTHTHARTHARTHTYPRNTHTERKGEEEEEMSRQLSSTTSSCTQPSSF